VNKKALIVEYQFVEWLKQKSDAMECFEEIKRDVTTCTPLFVAPLIINR